MIRELTGLSVDFLRKPRASGDDPYNLNSTIRMLE